VDNVGPLVAHGPEPKIARHKKAVARNNQLAPVSFLGRYAEPRANLEENEKAKYEGVMKSHEPLEWRAGQGGAGGNCLTGR